MKEPPEAAAVSGMLKNEPFPTLARLRALVAHWERHSTAALRDLDLNSNERLLLLHLLEGGPVGVVQLAHWIGITTGAVTIMVKRLEKRGLLIRIPHPSDGRRVMLYPSKRLILIYRESSMAIGETLEHLLNEFDMRTRDRIERFLDKAAIAIDETWEYDTDGTLIPVSERQSG